MVYPMGKSQSLALGMSATEHTICTHKFQSHSVTAEDEMRSTISIMSAAVSLVIGSAPAQATTYCPAGCTFGFADEYLVKSGTNFPGTSITVSGSALYQETTTGPSPALTKLTTGVSVGVPGEYVPNTNDAAGLYLNGFGQSLNYSTPFTSVFNTTAGNPFFRYTTGDTSSIGGLQGTTTPFNLTSFQLSGGVTVLVEGFLKGAKVDSALIPLTLAMTTYTENWNNIDTIEFFTSTGGSFGGGDSLSMTNVVLNDSMATPLPAALPLFLSGLGTIGLFGWRRRLKAAAAPAVAA